MIHLHHISLLCPNDSFDLHKIFNQNNPFIHLNLIDPTDSFTPYKIF